MRPFPFRELRPVVIFPKREVETLNDLVLHQFLNMSSHYLKLGHAVDDIDDQVEAVDLIADGQFHRRVYVAILLVAAHMNIAAVGTAIGQPVDQIGIAVEVEDYRFVFGEQAVEVGVGKTCTSRKTPCSKIGTSSRSIS